LQGIVLLLGLVKETPVIVSYKGTKQQDKEPEKKKVNTNVRASLTDSESGGDVAM